MATSKRANYTVLGAGSWGTALALQLAYAGNKVQLWAHSADHVALMQISHSNERYLPDVVFPKNLTVHAHCEQALQGSETIVIAVPSHAYLATLESVQPFYKGQGIVSATKGFATDGRLLGELVAERLPEAPFAVLSGPSFAKEVARQLPTTIILASKDAQYVNRLAYQISHGAFRAYTTSDVTGVQVGGAVKNVLAVAVGISDGLGFGANARSALITRGMAELIRLGVALGADQTTLIGLAGLGDLVLTCSENQSRNRRFGLAVGAGKTVQEALASIGQVVESVSTVNQVFKLATAHQVHMPITEQVFKLLNNEITPQQAATNLFARELRSE